MVYDVESDKSKLAELSSIAGSTSLPYIDIEGITITGFGEGSIDRAIEKRRQF